MNSAVVDIIGPVLNIYYCYHLGVLYMYNCLNCKGGLNISNTYKMKML